MIRNRKILIPLFILIIGAHGCNLFSSKTGDSEVVFAPTEVGTPEGDKVTRDIGPAGGTLASPDGRLTLTVPQNALTETVSFSIQPITNKAEGGLGLAYRLEPNGKTFTTPLQISVRYDDHDLEGTVSEALSIAYQDEKGSWRVQKTAKLDQAAKTLTVSATHFTDWAFLKKFRLEPATATLHVGDTLNIQIIGCGENGFSNKLFKFLDSKLMSCEFGDEHYWAEVPFNWFADIERLATARLVSCIQLRQKSRCRTLLR